MAQNGLFSLPIEIRFQIFDLLIPPTTLEIKSYWGSSYVHPSHLSTHRPALDHEILPPGFPALNLALSCHQIYNELLRDGWAKTTFQVGSFECLLNFLREIGAANASKIRNLDVRYEMLCKRAIRSVGLEEIKKYEHMALVSIVNHLPKLTRFSLSILTNDVDCDYLCKGEWRGGERYVVGTMPLKDMFKPLTRFRSLARAEVSVNGDVSSKWIFAVEPLYHPTYVVEFLELNKMIEKDLREMLRI